MKTLAAQTSIAAVLMTLSLAACATTPTPPPLVLTDADAGAVSLVRGQDLEIRLPLNAGTGYAWRLDAEARPLVLGGGSSRVTDAERPGGPVTSVYSYTALARGRTDLAFTLKRPWEPDRPDDRKAVFHVRVR
ncbi:MAG: protease inhibitor I42 family protein [Caulobacter sp.]|nr:protease inhibitor I42 family protein [Caulobacter sp.]